MAANVNARKWGAAPPAKAELYVAVDGLCRALTTWTTENAVFVSDGTEVNAGPGYVATSTVARITDTSLIDVGVPKGMYAITGMGGRYPDGIFLTSWQGGRSVATGNLYALEKDRWTLKLATDAGGGTHSYELPVRWRSGFLVEDDHLVVYTPAPTSLTSDPEQNVGGGTTVRTLDGKPIDGFTRLDASPTRSVPANLQWRAFPGGELAIMVTHGTDGTLTTYAASARTPKRQAIPGVESFTIQGGSADSFRLEIEQTRGGGRAVYGIDGARLESAAAPAKPPVERAPRVIEAGAPGDRWRVTAVGIFHDTGNGFEPVKLPPPSASADPASAVLKLESAELGGDELFVVASYDEKGIGWQRALPQRVLFRSHRPAETLRCVEAASESDVESSSGPGFESWPPTATAACRTPFALLSRTPPDVRMDDHAALLALLRAHPELGLDKPIELRAGERTFAGVAVTSLEQGRKTIETVAASIPIRGELLCADPDPVRTFPLR